MTMSQQPQAIISKLLIGEDRKMAAKAGLGYVYAERNEIAWIEYGISDEWALTNTSAVPQLSRRWPWHSPDRKIHKQIISSWAAVTDREE